MSLSVQISFSKLAQGQRVDRDTLNGLLQSIIISLQGAIDVTSIPDGSLVNVKFANNTINLSTKALDKSLTAAKVADGGLNADNLKADDYFYAAATLSGSVYGFALSPVGCNPTAYAAGQQFFFKADVANPAGGTDVNINSVAAADLKKPDGSELQAGDIGAGQIVHIIYNGTYFVVLSASFQPSAKLVKFSGDTKVSGVVFTVNTGTDIANTVAAHGMATGQALTVTTATTLPAGLIFTTVYYARVIDANNFTFHPTAADAAANTNIVNITTVGTGAHTLWYCPINAQRGVAYVVRTIGALATSAPSAGDYTVGFTVAFASVDYVQTPGIKSAVAGVPLIPVLAQGGGATTTTTTRWRVFDASAVATNVPEFHLNANGL